jgi:hypothetical protein
LPFVLYLHCHFSCISIILRLVSKLPFALYLDYLCLASGLSFVVSGLSFIVSGLSFLLYLDHPLFCIVIDICLVLDNHMLFI